jgi:hypothetical protein
LRSTNIAAVAAWDDDLWWRSDVSGMDGDVGIIGHGNRELGGGVEIGEDACVADLGWDHRNRLGEDGFAGRGVRGDDAFAWGGRC